MKSEKNLKFFSSIFFVQDVAWDIQKCILKGFFININTILNAPYPYDLKLKLPAPFPHFQKSQGGDQTQDTSLQSGVCPPSPQNNVCIIVHLF